MTAAELLGTPVDPSVSALVEAGRREARAARWEEARKRYEGALRALPTSGAEKAAGTLLRWIGRAHEDAGDWEAALDCYTAAEAVSRDSEVSPARRELARSPA